MFFSSQTDRLKSAIKEQDASLVRSVAELAGSVGLAKAGIRAAGVARAYPVPVALAGAGIAGAALAWFMLRPSASTTVAADKTEADSFARWEDDAGKTLDPDAIAAAIREQDREWIMAARAASDAARDHLLDLYERGVATAEARASVAAAQAVAMAAAFRQGLGHLNDEAASLTAEARAKVWDTLEQGGRVAGRGLDKGRRVAQDHPVATTAAGLAVGVGLMAMLLRGRGVLKVLAPLALTAALAEGFRRLRRNADDPSATAMAEDNEQNVKSAAPSAKKAARRTTRKAQATAKDTTGSVGKPATKTASAASPTAGKAATRPARGTKPSRSTAGARKSSAKLADELPNGMATH